MKKKIHIAAVIAVISVLNLTCLSACASEQTTAAVETQAADGQGDEVMKGQRGTMAQVTAVDGSTITIVESEGRGGGGRNSGPKGETPEGETGELPDGEEFEGEKPEMGEGKMTEKPDGEVPEMPEEEKPDGEVPEMPEREKPDGEMTDMTFNGEEKTITVSDSIIFTETDGEKTQASLSDISEGTVIMITYDEDGTTPTEIIIRK